MLVRFGIPPLPIWLPFQRANLADASLSLPNLPLVATCARAGRASRLAAGARRNARRPHEQGRAGQGQGTRPAVAAGATLRLSEL
jgi:hypothetical protein